MSDKRISELVELTSLAADDELPVVDADANATKRVTFDTLSAGVRGDIVDGDLPAGSIVQVVHAQATSEVIIATTTYTNTGLSASITPTSASNKVLAIFSQSFRFDRDNASMGFGARLMRGATRVYNQTFSNAFAGFLDAAGVSGIRLAGVISGNVLDSPATTSSVTYSMEVRPRFSSSNGVFYAQNGSGQDSSLVLMEVVA